MTRTHALPRRGVSTLLVALLAATAIPVGAVGPTPAGGASAAGPPSLTGDLGHGSCVAASSSGDPPDGTAEHADVETYAGTPAVYAENWSSGEIQATHRCDAELPTTNVVAMGDTLVVSATVPGLRAALRNHSADSRGAALRDLLATGRLRVTALQTERTTTPQKNRKALELPGAARVRYAYEDRFFLVVDTASLDGTYDLNGNGAPDDEPSATVRSGEAYDLSVSLDGVRTNTTVRFAEAAVEFDDHGGHALYRDAEPRQVLTGSTALAPGRDLVVEIRNASSGTLRRRTTTEVDPGEGPNVAGPRRFETTVDLSGFAARERLSVRVLTAEGTVLHDGRPLIVGEPRATVTIEAAAVNGSRRFVTGDADLPTGGYLVVHAGSARGPVVGDSGYLDPGEHSDVVDIGDLPQSAADAEGRLELVVVAYRDADHDQHFERGTDRRYLAGDGDTAAARTVVETDLVPVTTTPTATPTPTQTPVPMTPATATPTPTPPTTSVEQSSPASPTTTTLPGNGTAGSEGSDGGGLPGFGFPAALAALTAVAVLARRRR